MAHFIHKIRLIKFLYLVCFTVPAHAQLVAGNAFLKGRYVEVGMAPYGIWGTTVNAPAGYHARSAMMGDGPNYRKLGFVADAGKDGWNVGTPDKYNGDYFLPANPFMGWGLSIGPSRYLSERFNDGGAQAGFSSIPPGSIVNVTTSSTQSQAVWQTTIGGIAIRKTVTVPADKAYFTVRTVLTNTTAASQNGIYYFEYINPDNDAVFQDMITASPDAGTANSIVYQQPDDGKALIKALGSKTLAYLGLGSLDCRAKVVRGPSGDVSCKLGADQLYNGQNGSRLSGGDATNLNNYLAIAYNIGTIQAGDSTAVAYAYVLSEPDLDEALDQTSAQLQAGDNRYHSGENVLACPGSTLPMSIVNADALSWTWTPDPHLDVTTGKRVNVKVDNAPVTYTASATSPCGIRTLQITVTPSIPLPPAAAPDIYYCLNATPQPLSATGSNLQWNTDPASTTGSSTPPTPSTTSAGTTTYYVRQASGAGCISDPAAIHVTVRPTGKTTETVTLCPEKLPFTWHGISVAAPGNAVATYTATNQYGCDSIISLNLITIPPSAASISKTNDINCLTPSTQLHVSAGGVKYQWQPAGGLSDPAIADPVASPAATTTYHVSVTNNEGCIDTASVTVYVTPEGSYLLSNAFTPNNDGHNDCFGLQRAARSVEKIELSIFDRMGQQVFHTTNPADCWDGTFKGNPQPTGTYVYFIKGKGSCGIIDQKGTVMLVR